MADMQETETSVNEKLEIPKMDSSRGRMIALIAGLVVLVAAIAVYVLTRGPEASPYRAAEVSKASIVKEIRVTASVTLTDQVEVPAPIEGQLVEVAVQPGDQVEEGQLLARLDRVSAEVAYLVAQAESQVTRANVSEAEASVQRASRTLERT